MAPPGGSQDDGITRFCLGLPKELTFQRLVKYFLQVENSGDIFRKTESFVNVTDKFKSEAQKLLENCGPSLIF